MYETSSDEEEDEEMDELSTGGAAVSTSGDVVDMEDLGKVMERMKQAKV